MCIVCKDIWICYICYICHVNVSENVALFTSNSLLGLVLIKHFDNTDRKKESVHEEDYRCSGIGPVCLCCFRRTATAWQTGTA